MKKLLLFSLASMAAMPAYGAGLMLAGWDFNDGTVNTRFNSVYRPNYGPQTATAGLFVDGTNGSTQLLNRMNVSNVGERDIGGTGFNTTLSIRSEAPNTTDGFSAFSTSSNKNISFFSNNIATTTLNGKGVVFAFSTTGFEDIFVRMDASRAGVNSPIVAWSWSLDGVDFSNNFASIGLAPQGSSGTVDLDLRNVTALDNQANVFIRMAFSGQVAGSATIGAFNLDNIQIGAETSVVPEPSTWAAIAGLGVLGFAFVRRRLK